MPLVFSLKEMGYTVNISGDESRMLIVPPRERSKVVPDRAVKVGSVSPYRDGTMATEIFDTNGTRLIGWGGKVARRKCDEKQSVRYTGNLALEAPADYDEEAKAALAVDGRRIVIYSFDKGSRRIYPVPYAMEGAKNFRYDRGRVYFQRPGGIYAYEPKSKVRKRVVDREAEAFEARNGRVIYRFDGELYLHEEDREDIPLDSRAKEAALSASSILLNDEDLGLVTVLDADTLDVKASMAYDKSKRCSVKLMGDRYLALGQGNAVELRDLDSDMAYFLDMVNIEDTLKGRRVLWLYNGNVLKGYVYGDGVKIAQTITVHP